MENKVIYSFCPDYSPENVNRSINFIIENSVELIDKIKLSKKILIKPNLLAARPPEKAITTHPEVLISLINKIKEFSNAEIILADSPAGTFNAKAMKNAYTVCQMNRVAEETGCTLNQDFSELSVNFPEAKLVKKQQILNVAEEADLIINFAKLKTHALTTLTCATKNHYGIVPGLLKVKYHLTMTEPTVFADLIIDIERYFNEKTFHIVDGIVGMEGPGPSNGDPIESKCIFAGYNSINVDILACKIMGVETKKITTITQAQKRGIIDNINPNNLDIISDHEIETFKFNIPPDRNTSLPSIIPQWVVRSVNNLFISIPVVEKSKCIGCKACEESCPPELIKVINNIAVIDDYSTCVRCYCCQEVCPNNAIKLKQPLGLKLLKLLKIK